MNPHSRRRVYLVFVPVGWVVIVAVWLLQESESPVVRSTYPVLLAYLIAAWLCMWYRWTDVVAVERSTFWMLASFWLASMAIRLNTAVDPDAAWRGLSPSIFMGLTILVVMAFLWFDTGAALLNAMLLPVLSSIIGVLYFARHAGRDDSLLIDLIRYEIYLAITAVFVYALARSKDALIQTQDEAESMRALAYLDPLTGLSNRRQALDELNMLAGNDSEAGIVLLDLDEFKMVNDRYGHDIGDLVLIKVAEILRSVDSRLASRWGGEEFLLVFDGGQAMAVPAAEQLRQRLAAAEFPDGIHLTASFGVSSLTPGAAVSDVLRLADGQLYRAKNDGRNLVREQHAQQ